MEVLDGGYISWVDKSTGLWWQRQRFGDEDNIRSLGKLSWNAKNKSKRRSAIALTLTQQIQLLRKSTETKEEIWRKEARKLTTLQVVGSVNVRDEWKELVPTDLDQLYDALNRISDTQLFVFRGHGNKQWPHLVTSLSRTLQKITSPVEQSKLEAEGISAFWRHGRSQLQASELIYFDRILYGVTLMQHYGAPTRLLDWTLSPWVAAYFGVFDESQLDQDGVIWAFNQAHLLKNYYQQLDSRKSEYVKFEQFISSSQVEAWLKGALEQTRVITTFRYQYANPQMGAQQSLFTVCGSVLENHNIALKRVLRDDWDTLKIVIPVSMKAQLRRQLFLMNVNALSLFPNINGVGLYISEAHRSGFPLGDEALLYLVGGNREAPSVKLGNARPRSQRAGGR